MLCSFAASLSNSSVLADEISLGEENEEGCSDRIEAGHLAKRSKQLREQGQYEEALPLAEASLECFQKLLGDEHAETVASLCDLAKLYKSTGDYDEAESLFQRCLSIQLRLFGEEHAEIARSLDELGTIARLKGTYGEAELLHERSLEIRRHLLGDEDLATADSLNNLALLYQTMGHFGKAAPLFRQSLAITRKVVGEDHVDTASSLQNLAGLYFSEGKYEEADIFYQQSLAIRRRVQGEGHRDTATCLLNLAVLHNVMGNYKSSETLFHQGLSIRRRVLGPEHPSTAAAVNNLATLYYSIGEYGKAEPFFRESLDINRKILGEEHPNTGTCMNNLAMLYKLLGRYGEAEDLYLRSLSLSRKVNGEEHHDTAISLNNLALLYRDMGEYGKAEPLYQQSLAITLRTQGKEHASSAISLNNLAGFYQSIGEYAKAEPLYEQALEIMSKVKGEEHPDTASILNNMALLYQLDGEFSRAEPLFRRSLSISRQVFGENHRQTAIGLNNLARLQQQMGRFETAERLYRQSLAVRRQVFGEKHIATAEGLFYLATLYVSMGEDEQAEPLYLESLAIRRQVLGEVHPHTALTRFHLAKLQLRARNLSSATSYARQALVANLNHLHFAFPAVAGIERLRFVQQLREKVDLYLSATEAAGADPFETWSTILPVKGQVFLLDSAIRRLESSPVPERRALLYRFRGLSSRLSALERSGKSGSIVEEARKAYNEVDKRLAALVSEELPNANSPEALVDTLPPGTALLDFYEYNHFIAPEVRGQEGSWARRFACFVLRPGEQVRRVALGPSQPIHDLISRWRGALWSQNQLSERALAAELRALVWEPLLSSLEGVTSVLLSPDGPLHLIPFVALLDSTGNKRLLEDFSLSLAPIPQLLGASSSLSNEAPSLLLLGNVDYGAAQGQTSPEPVSRSAFRSATENTFAPLPETALEIEGIEKSFRRLWAEAPVGRFTGGNATEGAIKPALSSHRFLHLSTHGFVFGDTGGGAEDAGRPDMFTELAQLSRGGEIDPRSRVGLALAGANRPLEIGHDDGTLTALEVNLMDLSHVDLVVTSACETAIGAEAQGEGLLGLQRAFQAAGARTSISSLWKVPDHATRLLLERFYNNLWGRKMSKVEALREAQQWMLREGALELDPEWQGWKGRWKRLWGRQIPQTSPMYWAAFQLAGER